MEEFETIDLREYFEIIWNKIWVVLLISFLLAATSGVISFFILEPVYETSTTLMVGKTKELETQIQYNDVLLSQKLVKTYGEIAKSRTVSKEVIDNLKLDLNPEQLKGKISVNLVGDTEIIMVKVQDTDPALATTIANNLAQVFMKHVVRIMKVDNVQVIDKAEIPIKPIRPRPMLNVAIATFTGLMLGLGIVFLLAYLDNTVKTPSDVEKYLELPIIGAIPVINEITADVD